MQNPGYATGCRSSESCRVYSPALGLCVANCGQSECRMTMIVSVSLFAATKYSAKVDRPCFANNRATMNKKRCTASLNIHNTGVGAVVLHSACTWISGYS